VGVLKRYIEKLILVSLGEEEYMWKKFLLVLLTILFFSSIFPVHQAMGQASIIATISVQPTNSFGINLGDTFSINITVSNVIDLVGWQFNLYYKSAVLKATSYSEGPFLQTGGITTLFNASSFTDHYNATFGVVTLYDLRLSNLTGVNGSGTLATINFTVIGSGASVLHLDPSGFIPTKLIDSNNNLIPFTLVDGEAPVIPEFPSFLILPLFFITTLFSAILYKKERQNRFFDAST
jgi:hypothetical protein